MQVVYTDFSRVVGYNYKETKPFYLEEHVFFIVEYANKKIRERIQRGFKSDGCTIPYVFRWLMGCPHTGAYLPASLIHDWILEHPEVVHYNRQFASRIFKQALLNEGVSPLKAHVMYMAVEFWQSVKNLKGRKWR